MILAAIDLGSNAIRLMITEVDEEGKKPRFQKLNLVRVPLRLGMEVFNGGKISKKKEHQLIDTLKAYVHLMKVYQVEDYRAVASSAMRDATNGEQVSKRALQETKIDLQIISGMQEAQLLFLNQSTDTHDSIYIDVGGGSTEITVKKNGKILNQKSFNLGTLRLLHSQDTLDEWNSLKDFIKKYKNKKYELVGTGGNINKTFSLLKIKEGKPIKKNQLDKFYNALAQLTVTERMEKYKIREDRADVIVHALSIFRFVMEHIKSDEIYVPKLGLADALVKNLYYEKLNSK